MVDLIRDVGPDKELPDDRLRPARVAGLASDIVATFLRELAEGAGLTLHVRLIEGSEPEHVLEAIFKALGVALAQSCRPLRRRRRDR